MVGLPGVLLAAGADLVLNHRRLLFGQDYSPQRGLNTAGQRVTVDGLEVDAIPGIAWMIPQRQTITVVPELTAGGSRRQSLLRGESES